MPNLVLFLDDGGVMNDNRVRAKQWQRLVGEFFAPLLGGTPDAWAEANRVVSEAVFEPRAWNIRLRRARDYDSFIRAYMLDWLGSMCELVGVTRPPDDQAVDLGNRADVSICRRVDAALPGAVEAIRALYTAGYQVHTASGESSLELAGYLGSMGVRDCFGRLYGPDLLGVLKSGPEFYERMFGDAGLSPGEAVVVDDSPMALGWAAQAGARTVLVGDPATAYPGDMLASTQPADASWIRSLADLPEAVERLR